MSIEEIPGQEIGFARDPRLSFILFWSRDQNAWVESGARELKTTKATLRLFSSFIKNHLHNNINKPKDLPGGKALEKWYVFLMLSCIFLVFLD